MPLSLWDLAAVGIKAVTYAATFGAAGAVLFLGYNFGLDAMAVGEHIRRLIGKLAAIAILASSLRIMVLMGSMSGDLSGMFDISLARMILSTGEGRATGIRIVGLALVTLAVLGPRYSAAAAAGAVLAATSFAWVGHAAALAQPLLPVLKHGVHLLCVTFWLGALAPLLILARDGELTQLAKTAARFGRIAAVVVALLIFAGVSLLWQLVASEAVWWASDYGRVVIVKLGLVACLLVFAALNKWRLTPRLLSGDATAAQGLANSIKVELLIGALILLATATFTTVYGPSSEI